ncbi:MAG: DUF4236 domain-containing protein [Anaerolineae bacterium]|nr:DUF4236 domain-containing protein [Anaerolineae bacterium]
MGFRLQRYIRLGKFLRLNISKSGVGVSAGFPGLRLSAGPRGSFINLGLPGTGLSYRKKIGDHTLLDFSDISDMLGSKNKEPQQVTAKSTANQPEIPSPGFFAPFHEKALAKGVESYDRDNVDEALQYFLDAAPDEPGAAILAAAILAEKDDKSYEPIQLLENVIQSDGEFPTELMVEYLADVTITIAITPKVSVDVPVDGLAATLLLVELYQSQRRVREAIALLEEIIELNSDPVLILSLCELYTSRDIWDGIIEIAKNTESEDNVTLEILIFYGRAMQEKEMHEAAISVYTKALRRTKDRNPLLLQEAAYWRALAYQAQGKHRRANQEFQKLFADNPDFKDVRQRLQERAIRK